jgi:WD40 repeat protein
MKLDLVKELTGHTEDRIWHVSWSTDGTHLASCGEDKVIRIWTLTESRNWEDAVCICSLEEGTQTRTIRSCEWSPDNRKIASASFCGIVSIWETQNNQRTVWDQLASLEGHENEVKSVCWSPDGKFLASCGRDKKIWLWEDMGPSEFECACILEGHTQDVKSVRFHPTGTILFSSSYDDTIKVWTEDGGDWYCSDTLSGHSSTVWGLSLTLNGKYLVSCSADFSLRLWESTSFLKWKHVSTLDDCHSQPIYSIDSIHSCIVTGGGDDKICFLSCDGSNGSMTSEIKIKAHDGDVNCVM